MKRGNTCPHLELKGREVNEHHEHSDQRGRDTRPAILNVLPSRSKEKVQGLSVTGIKRRQIGRFIMRQSNQTQDGPNPDKTILRQAIEPLEAISSE